MRYRPLVEKQRFTIRHHKLVNLGLLPSNSSRFGQSFATKEAAATKCHWGRMMSSLFFGNQAILYFFLMLCDCLILSNHGMDITTNTEFFAEVECVTVWFIYILNQPVDKHMWQIQSTGNYDLTLVEQTLTVFLFVTCLTPKLQEMICFGEHVSL